METHVIKLPVTVQDKLSMLNMLAFYMHGVIIWIFAILLYLKYIVLCIVPHI